LVVKHVLLQNMIKVHLSTTILIPCPSPWRSSLFLCTWAWSHWSHPWEDVSILQGGPKNWHFLFCTP